jgi:hypothetical protein
VPNHDEIRHEVARAKGVVVELKSYFEIRCDVRETDFPLHGSLRQVERMLAGPLERLRSWLGRPAGPATLEAVAKLKAEIPKWEALAHRAGALRAEGQAMGDALAACKGAVPSHVLDSDLVADRLSSEVRRARRVLEGDEGWRSAGDRRAELRAGDLTRIEHILALPPEPDPRDTIRALNRLVEARSVALTAVNDARALAWDAAVDSLDKLVSRARALESKLRTPGDLESTIRCWERAKEEAGVVVERVHLLGQRVAWAVEELDVEVERRRSTLRPDQEARGQALLSRFGRLRANREGAYEAAVYELLDDARAFHRELAHWETERSLRQAMSEDLLAFADVGRGVEPTDARNLAAALRDPHVAAADWRAVVALFERDGEAVRACGTATTDAAEVVP